MNPQEHVDEAVKLDTKADHYIYGDGADPVVGHAFATRALTHATLAVAGFIRDAAAATPSEPVEVPTSNVSCPTCGAERFEGCRRVMVGEWEREKIPHAARVSKARAGDTA